MSGHSHWATIRRQKAAVDAKKGKVFSKCAKAIISAARTGGGDPNANTKLRYAVDDARAVNMPKDKIDRAILKGTGELEGQHLAEAIYEGYGVGGVALIVEAVTDNRNRTTPEIRRIFEHSGGSLTSQGSVAWMFRKKGVLSVKRDAVDEDTLMETVLEAGADDMATYDDLYEITCEPSAFGDVKQALLDNDISADTAQMANVAKQNVAPSIEDARKVVKLMEALEEHDDVQNVSANFDIPAELMVEMT